MKYIKTDNLYMVEDFELFLNANPLIDYSLNDLNFRLDDIAYVRINHFKPLDKSHYNVEIYSKKESLFEEAFFAIADSPLNIVSSIMNYEKFNEMDLMPIMRFTHFQLMIDRLKTQARNLNEKNEDGKEEFLVLLFNEESQKLLAEYVLLDAINPNENFLFDFAEEGFFPIYFETRRKTEKIYQEFLDVYGKNKKIEQGRYYIHPYNSIGGQALSDIEKTLLQDRLLHFKRILINKYEILKEKYISEKIFLDNAIEEMDVLKEVFDDINDEYEELKKNFCFEVNIVPVINLLSLGIYSFEQLDEMQNIYINTLKENDEIRKKRSEFFWIVDEAIESFKEEAKNKFKG